MGGLVARQYIESSDYQNDVDQLIFIATPHRGAPRGYLLLEGGDIDLDYLYNLIYKIFIQGKAEIEGYKSRPFYDGVMHYVQEKVPSVRELLPVYDYLRDASTGLMRHYPDNYPINAFLERLNLPSNLAKINTIKITNILGDDGDSTINAFRVIPPLLYEVDGKWQYGIPENYNLPFTDRGLEMGAGDSTVPKYSNSNFNGVSDTIIPNASHLSVVSKSQQAIIKELTGQEPEQTISSTIIDHLLVFQIFSPADFQVISPDGKIIGRDLDSAGLINEIINGYYTGFDDPLMPEMVIISNPMAGDYKIKLIGTENGGSYKMSVSGISGATSSESSYSGVILSDQQQEINVNYSTSSAAVSPLKPDITIESAISDVGLIYQRGLLNDNNYKKKIIRRYESISRELAKIEKFEDKKKCQKDKQIDKQREKLIEDFWDFDKYLKKLVEKGVLMQLGYDIIKSNNEYLINNL